VVLPVHIWQVKLWRSARSPHWAPVMNNVVITWLHRTQQAWYQLAVVDQAGKHVDSVAFRNHFIDFPDREGSRSETRLHRSWVLETMRWGCNVRERTQSNKRSAVVGATTKTTTMEVRWSTAAMHDDNEERRSVKAESLVDGFPARNCLQGSRWKPTDAKRQSDS